MSDSVLAALIAAAATIFTSLMQLKAALAKEVAARTQPTAGRRRPRTPVLLLIVMVAASAVGGFAVAQWITEDERLEQDDLRRELQARIHEISTTASRLERARADTRADIETEVLRELGAQGATALATVAPCRPPAPAAAATPDAAQAVSCSESDATRVTLCVTIPARATVTDIELYTRFADDEAPWIASRVAPGQEVDKARFADTHTEHDEDAAGRVVCQGFAHWSSDRARVARMVVRYSV